MPRRALPPGLAWVLLAVFIAATAWAFAVPVFQAPDEDAHVAYVQTLAELGRRPAPDPRPDEEGAKATEQDLLERASGFLSSHQRIEADPEWSAAAGARGRAAQARLGNGARRDGGDANPA